MTRGLGAGLALGGVVMLAVACGRTALLCADGEIEDDGYCVSADAASLSCGPGTERVGNECVPRGDGGVDAHALDASADAGDAAHDAAVADAQPYYPDGEATSFAIDPAHDNAQPNETVASPLDSSWSVSFNGKPAFPLVVDGKVIIGAVEAQPNVRALDVSNGALVWGPIVVGASLFDNGAQIASDAGRVYILDGDGLLVAVSLSDGAHLWTTQLKGQLDFESPPVATGGMVYVNGLESGGTTYGLDGATGQVVWTANTFDGSDGTVAVQSGVVYEAEACAQLTALDALTGGVLWHHSGDCTGGGGAAPAVYQGLIWERDWASGDLIIDSSGKDYGSFTSSVVPALHGGVAFYTASGTLTAVDIASSTVVWEFVGDGSLCTSAVVAGGGAQVFVASSQGNVYELDEATGAQISSVNAGSVLCGDETHAMSLGEHHLFVPLAKGLAVY